MLKTIKSFLKKIKKTKKRTNIIKSQEKSIKKYLFLLLKLIQIPYLLVVEILNIKIETMYLRQI